MDSARGHGGATNRQAMHALHSSAIIPLMHLMDSNYPSCNNGPESSPHNFGDYDSYAVVPPKKRSITRVLRFEVIVV
jgi:hypothetical protein